MLLEVIFLIAGIILLLKGADYLVDGASSLAKKFKISPFLIGLTIVSLGTTMPELIVNIFASLSGNGEIAFGNILGSNIANILLILGIIAIIHPIPIKRSTIKKEIPFALLAVLVLIALVNFSIIDNLNYSYLSRTSGIILFSFLLIFLYYIAETSIKQRLQNKNKLDAEKRKYWIITIMILFGTLALFIGGKLTIMGATSIASFLNISDFLISATIIAVGTSLPELITGIRAALRGKVDIALGNVVGANILNIFWALGLSAIINPIKIPLGINLNLAIVLVATVILFMAAFISKTLRRKQGIFFIILYIAYILFLIIRG